MIARGIALAVFAAAVAVTSAACSGASGSGKDDGAAWLAVKSTLAPGLVDGSPEPCLRGDRSCLDIVIAEMKRRAEPLADSCDHDALFATMYLRMTEQVRDAYDAGRLENPAATANFTAWFANYYFDAYDAWHAGDTDAVPEAWRIAFEAADERTVRGLGNLLLGMNAHVSRDLAYVVADVLASPRDTVDPDYALVNSLIADLSGGLVVEVADRFDPSLYVVSIPLEAARVETFGEAVTLWRRDSWDKGNELAGADGTGREAVIAGIEEDATDRALAIESETGFLAPFESTRGRDGYCEDKR